MNETEFNLIDEPWIRVMNKNCEIEEVSLTDAIINAHNYKSLKGELPTQDVAVMRLILAVLHTVFSRYDENGNLSQLENKKNKAVKRWKALCENAQFPQNAVKEYLEAWHERFWLFHPERPFFQVAALEKGGLCSSAKLNGEISQSNNKMRLFSSYSGEEKERLSYSQATRWLLYINSFDDVALKKYTDTTVSAKRGWLGQLGLITLVGNNLFDTLMLNMVMVNDDITQFNQKPVWENETVSSKERNLLSKIPDNLAELYTVQFRRILLERKDEKVTGYIEVVGDIFPDNMVLYEPMTVRKEVGTTDKSTVPKKHDSSIQMWRNFASLYNYKGNMRPGVLQWYDNIISDDEYVTTAISSVVYDEKQGASLPIINVYSDSLSMHSAILTELGESWRNDIELEIERCEKITFAVSNLARNLYIADGGSDNPKDTEAPRENAKAQLYYRLDMPFRKWLNSINPEIEDTEYCDDKKKEWHENAIKIAISYGNELVNNASETAFIGHMVSDKNGKKEMCSAPKALNIYKGQVNKIYKDGDK